MFSTLNSKTSRNMRKLRHKVCNGQNFPMKVRILQIIIFKVTLRTILAIFPQVWDLITRTVFSKYFFLFSILNSRMSKNMYIWRHKLCNSKTGVGQSFTWSNEPWSNRKSKKSLKRAYKRICVASFLKTFKIFDGFWGQNNFFW